MAVFSDCTHQLLLHVLQLAVLQPPAGLVVCSQVLLVKSAADVKADCVQCTAALASAMTVSPKRAFKQYEWPLG